MAPGNLWFLCQPVYSVPCRRNLRSADRRKLKYPRITTNMITNERCAFAAVGLTTWNSLPDDLKNIINLFPSTFRCYLRPPSLSTSTLSKFEVFYKDALCMFVIIIIIIIIIVIITDCEDGG